MKSNPVVAVYTKSKSKQRETHTWSKRERDRDERGIGIYGHRRADARRNRKDFTERTSGSEDSPLRLKIELGQLSRKVDLNSPPSSFRWGERCANVRT